MFRPVTSIRQVRLFAVDVENVLSHSKTQKSGKLWACRGFAGLDWLRRESYQRWGREQNLGDASRLCRICRRKALSINLAQTGAMLSAYLLELACRNASGIRVNGAEP